MNLQVGTDLPAWRPDTWRTGSGATSFNSPSYHHCLSTCLPPGRASEAITQGVGQEQQQLCPPASSPRVPPRSQQVPEFTGTRTVRPLTAVPPVGETVIREGVAGPANFGAHSEQYLVDSQVAASFPSVAVCQANQPPRETRSEAVSIRLQPCYETMTFSRRVVGVTTRTTQREV